MATQSTLIIAATESELAWLGSRLQARQDRMLLDFPVNRASGTGGDTLLITSGPGMASAAAAAAAAIVQFQPGRIFNTGICGVYASDRALVGTAVMGEHAIFADTGAAEAGGFACLQDMGLPLASPGGKPLYNSISLDCPAASSAIARADFLTVATVSGSPAAAAELSGRFPPPAGRLVCEDMESAAVGLIALRSHIPCTIVRGISNVCGERDHAKWNISGAARAAQETLCTLLEP